MTAPRRFELNIDALVLEGVSPGPGLRQAVESELLRLLSADGALDHFAQFSSAPLQLDLARIDAGTLSGLHGGAALGIQLGRAIYKSLRAVPSGAPSSSQPMQPRIRTQQERKP